MTIEEITQDDLGRLEPLWLSLHAHHQVIAPQLAPYVGDAESWAVRRTVYEAALAEGGFALIAREAGLDLGYALHRRSPSHWSATFVTSADLAELETVAVAPEARGRGIGSALLDAVDERVAATGVTDDVVGVVQGNDRAIELYRRRGYTPAWVTLTRFQSQPPPPAVVPDAVVEDVPPAEIDGLRSLWLSLHHHHQAVASELGPFIGDEASWETVRGLLASDSADGELLRVGPKERPDGFICVAISHDDPLWADTWRVGRDVAEITFLVVADHARGRGLGSTLLEAVDARLAVRGITDQAVGAIEPNHGAIRLYESRGFRRAWLELTRFGPKRGRPDARPRRLPH